MGGCLVIYWLINFLKQITHKASTLKGNAFGERCKAVLGAVVGKMGDLTKEIVDWHNGRCTFAKDSVVHFVEEIGVVNADGMGVSE